MKSSSFFVYFLNLNTFEPSLGSIIIFTTGINNNITQVTFHLPVIIIITVEAESFFFPKMNGINGISKKTIQPGCALSNSIQRIANTIKQINGVIAITLFFQFIIFSFYTFFNSSFIIEYKYVSTYFSEIDFIKPL